MPYSAPAAIAAIARYGFTSPPGTRFSTRNALGATPNPAREASPGGPDRAPTTRSAHVRLSKPQRTAVGANDPGRNRLQELTFGAYSRVNSRMVASSPAMAY